jgi:sterol desaturase/sphingolipid hydroxylase (fatty acid hydroxylase superfamily)
MNSLFDKLMERRLEFKVHVIDEKALMANMQKIANRITVGLILAALIVGAALMMQIQSNLSFLGYPAIATIMFLLAALLGFYLVIDILLQDRKNK